MKEKMSGSTTVSAGAVSKVSPGLEKFQTLKKIAISDKLFTNKR
jgi:hypothetical protein